MLQGQHRFGAGVGLGGIIMNAGGVTPGQRLVGKLGGRGCRRTESGILEGTFPIIVSVYG